MVDPNEIGGWIDACPNPALLIAIKAQIEDRLRQLKDSEAAKALHPQLKRHMPDAAPVAREKPGHPGDVEQLPSPPPAAAAHGTSSTDNPYEAFGKE